MPFSTMTVVHFFSRIARSPAPTAKGLVRRIVPAVDFAMLLVVCSFARQPPSASGHPDPAELMRQSVDNEISAAHDDTAHFLFRGVKTTPKGSTTRLYVETHEATAGLVIGYNGQSLSPEQRRDEAARVERFINNPDEMKKKREQERQNAEHTLRIMRAMADAFVFEYAGEEPGTEAVGRSGDPLVKLSFRPNPGYQPPSHVEEVLAGMQGYVLVDAERHRIARIDGTLFKEVGFGWGILGHLDRGGRFIVQQQEVGDNLWEISSMTLNFTGKILLFKNLNIDSTELFNGFKRVPTDLTFAQAFELLKKEEAAETSDKTASSKVAQ
jgi:hypothetical protein